MSPRWWRPRWLLLAAAALGLAALVSGALLWQRHRLAVSRDGAAFEPRELVQGGNQPLAPRMPAQSELFDAAALEAAADYAARHDSRALIVSRHGYVVFERYWQGTSFDTLADAQDFTPLLAALAAGVAMSHRMIGWPDEPVAAFISEWSQDPRGAITVRNLMQMSSGLGPSPAAPPGDLLARTLATALIAAPGATRVVKPSDPQLLALVVERATHERYASYLSRAVWRRIGAADAWLWLDHAGGTPHADCCMLARQGDWIRLGELLLKDGNYRGGEVIRPGWVTLMRLPARPDTRHGAYLTLASARGGGQEPYAARDLFVIGSAGGNRLWLVPSMQLAILCTGPAAGRDPTWDDARVPNLIMRAAGDYQPPAPPGTDLKSLVPGH